MRAARCLAALLSAAVGTGCAGHSKPQSPETSADATWRKAYDCEGIQFEVRTEKKAVEVFLPGRSVRLPQVKAGSGAKYTDGSVTFWSKGEDALLELDGTLYRGCRINPARAVQEGPRTP